jgi:hypothetical protein
VKHLSGAPGPRRMDIFQSKLVSFLSVTYTGSDKRASLLRNL